MGDDGYVTASTGAWSLTREITVPLGLRGNLNFEKRTQILKLIGSHNMQPVLLLKGILNHWFCCILIEETRGRFRFHEVAAVFQSDAFDTWRPERKFWECCATRLQKRVHWTRQVHVGQVGFYGDGTWKLVTVARDCEWKDHVSASVALPEEAYSSGNRHGLPENLREKFRFAQLCQFQFYLFVLILYLNLYFNYVFLN